MEEIVKVRWLDAQKIEVRIIQDHELKDINPIPCEIVGFKVYEDEDKILIAQERWEYGMGSKYIHAIPKCSIIKITKLKEIEENEN